MNPPITGESVDMAYCRLYEDDSEVYAWRSGSAWNILTHDDQCYTVRSLRAFYDRLLELRQRGYRVPDAAIRRAGSEMRATR